MAAQITVYGAQGSGSVTVEAALTLLGVPYELVDFLMESEEAFVAGVRAVNPMLQVPAILLPSGELMTESAAILVWLADTYGGLTPPLDDPKRAQLLRWMAFVSSSIYALCWVRDVPSRLAATPQAEEVIRERTKTRIADCWRLMDEQVSPARYILGDTLTVLDLYVTVISRWIIRRRGFYAAAPKMAQVVRRVDADPRLAAFWAERFPFTEGWEG